MVPQVAGFLQFMSQAAFLLFLTTLHGASNSQASGRRSWTCLA
jgi:hypothetical protein